MEQQAVLDTKRIIAINLNRFMEYKNLTRKKVCADLDIKYTTFCEWVNGRAYPRIEALENLASYFGVQVGDFFFDCEQNNTNSDERIMSYVKRVGELDMNISKKLSEKQLQILLESGVHIQRKSLEDYIKESGQDKLIPSTELHWGEPMGDEIW